MSYFYIVSFFNLTFYFISLILLGLAPNSVFKVLMERDILLACSRNYTFTVIERLTDEKIHKTLNCFIAMVWLVNGLLCKILNLVPRHEQIVGRILGYAYAKPLTFLIGLSEILMAIWVSLRFKSRLAAITQMVLVASMNILEFFLAPDLLLWGRLNILFAFMFVGLVYYSEFIGKKSTFKRLV